LAFFAFFFYVVNILAFVNQPPWHIKAVIIAQPACFLAFA
jgi:hypothetical protein